MMLSKAFLSQVIRHRDMLQRTLAVVVDEAHVVSHWGSGFRKQYGTLGILKALLPRETPFVALSATLPPRVRNDVEKKLQLYEERCPKDLWYKGFIRPYSAAFSSAYRHAVMVLFRMGIVRILINSLTGM